MKKLTGLFILLIVLFSTNLNAQISIGYVDSDSILEKLPEAIDAQKKIDSFIEEWQIELKALEKEWKDKYSEYEKRKLMMSGAKRIETEKNLVKLENGITEYRQKKFGVNGELFRKQETLMKPVQNKIFKVIEEVAKENDFDYVFDKSGDIMFLYAKDEYDITNLVLEKLLK